MQHEAIEGTRDHALYGIKAVLNRVTALSDGAEEDDYTTIFLVVTQALSLGDEGLPANVKIHWWGTTRDYARDIWAANKELTDELWEAGCKGEKLAF